MGLTKPVAIMLMMRRRSVLVAQADSGWDVASVLSKIRCFMVVLLVID
jgi:hypothetical protein